MTILFGGAFNPPHVAHKIICEIAHDEYKPENFIIIPTPNPPHKTLNNNISFDVRVKWCLSSFNSKFTISDIEKNMKKPSYTLNTIKYFYKNYSDIHLLIGEDMLNTFDKWYKWKEILSKCKLIVFPRFTEKKTKNLVEHIKLDAPIIDISSTLIRQRISNRKTIKYLVEETIIDDVIKHFSGGDKFEHRY